MYYSLQSVIEVPVLPWLNDTVRISGMCALGILTALSCFPMDIAAELHPPMEADAHFEGSAHPSRDRQDLHSLQPPHPLLPSFPVPGELDAQEGLWDEFDPHLDELTHRLVRLERQGALAGRKALASGLWTGLALGGGAVGLGLTLSDPAPDRAAMLVWSTFAVSASCAGMYALFKAIREMGRVERRIEEAELELDQLLGEFTEFEGIESGPRCPQETDLHATKSAPTGPDQGGQP